MRVRAIRHLLTTAAFLLTALSGCRTPFSGASVTIVNGSEEPICDLLISPVDEDYWGDDWLAEGEMITPGSQRVFELEAGEYDLMALGCMQNEIDTLWGQPIDGAFTWTAGQG